MDNKPVWTAAKVMEGAGLIKDRTLRCWPRERLAQLWELNAAGASPATIAESVTKSFPTLPAVSNYEIRDFIRVRKVRRGEAVPDPIERPDCWLYRDVPAFVEADQNENAPGPTGAPAVIEISELPWCEIRDWARRVGVRQADDQSDNDFLRAVNGHRLRHALPVFRPAREDKRWAPGWSHWASIDGWAAKARTNSGEASA